MAQNKISRRSFLRGAGASATIAAASCMAPSAAACDIKSLWSMDLQILATSDTHGKFAHVDQLGDVDGIGPARLEKLRELVRV